LPKSDFDLKLRFDERGVISLSTKEVQQIFTKFKPLYINKVYNQGSQKKTVSTDQECTFTPKLCRSSERL